jgi:hypothetical protein
MSPGKRVISKSEQDEPIEPATVYSLYAKNKIMIDLTSAYKQRAGCLAASEISMIILP